MSSSLPFVLVAVFVTLVGACVGSFLNVVIARVPAGESIVRPGSRCPRCRTAIRWYDNVPVVSWVVLRARCRACGQPISARYPVVEALVAAAALAAIMRHGPSLAAGAEFVLVALLVSLAAIDLDTWLLPHALTWPLVALGVGAAALGAAPASSLALALLGASVGFAAFALLAYVGEKLAGREALGFGDVWLLCGLGAWLGVAALLPVVLLASVQGAMVGILLLATGRAQKGPSAPAGDAPPKPDEDAAWVPPRNAVPFGPFLALGALEWLYLGAALARWFPVLQVFRG